MHILARSPTDILIEKAEQKAAKKAHEKEVKMVLKMINKNYDDEEIQDLCDFTLEEITKIREEHLNLIPLN